MYAGSLAARVLRLLLSHYSPTGLERWAAEALVEEAWRLGFDEAFLDPEGSPHLVKYPRREGYRGEDRVALVSHIDTVPGWVEPVSPPGVLRGRGAVDAKAPLASMVAAASLYEPVNRPLEVVAAVGEEGPSNGAWWLVESGWRASAVIIGEPTNDTKVAVGYRGGCRVVVECLGEPGHSSSPHLYLSACSQAVAVYHAAEELSSERVTGPSLAVTGMRCGGGGNVVAEEAVVVIDARIPPGMTVEEVLRALEERLPPGCVARRASRCLPPVRVPVNTPAARALTRALLGLGVRPVPVIKAGTSDMNILYAVAGSIAAYGPGRSELSHTRYEEVTLEELDLATRVYLEAVRQLDTPVGGAAGR